MTLFSALAVLRVNRPSCDLLCLLAFTAALMGLVRNGMVRRDLRCCVFISGGAAAALPCWSLVLLAGGPLTVSNLTFSLSLSTLYSSSSRTWVLCFVCFFAYQSPLELIGCYSLAPGPCYFVSALSSAILCCIGGACPLSTLGTIGGRFEICAAPVGTCCLKHRACFELHLLIVATRVLLWMPPVLLIL